ncbi:hypothetical protein [Oceanicella actignis]|uniref:Uncharacterized protein n=1 Tax=Oceanicella actignis TaxID=1189325 RepID=A0A1M7SQJ8_9RHOB|nr:hypothetical protein [Oceanicella actignis]SES66595.1 hypothetical protein SAMN04488119_10189 [Oceanicella actignis]SHN60638.1 hypothetical protein SAMN05216200_10390 [Oceanicella actignis]
MSAEGWDFKAQRADTEWVFRQLLAQGVAARGRRVALDVLLVPAEEQEGARPDPEGLVRALRREGFEAHLARDEGRTVVEATAPDTPFDLEEIWLREKRATRIALRHGYEPEGWGFPEED